MFQDNTQNNFFLDKIFREERFSSERQKRVAVQAHFRFRSKIRLIEISSSIIEFWKINVRKYFELSTVSVIFWEEIAILKLAKMALA